MEPCLFCRIAGGEIPSEKVYEDEFVYAFEDINPQAPVHVLIVPKRHIARVEDLCHSDAETAGRLLTAAAEIAKQKGLTNGFRAVFNNGADGGQEVEHIHLHLIGGVKMGWPPFPSV